MVAKNPHLFEALSDLDGRRTERFADIALELRASGLLAPTKRGLASNPVTPGSAATMLLASLTGAPPSKAARAVEVYGTLKPKRKGGFGAYVPVLSAAAACDDFLGALAVLIACGSRLKDDILKVVRRMFPDVPEAHLLELSAITIEVSVTWPMPSARLVMKAVDDQGVPREEFVAEWIIDARRMMAGKYREEIVAASADKAGVSTITHKSIFALSELIGEAEPVAGHGEPEAITEAA